jgi:hypothetical protein
MGEVDTLGFKTRIPQVFDLDEFELMYQDCSKSLDKNLDWSKLTNNHDNSTLTDAEKKQHLIAYFKKFFGIRARMEGRIVFSVYHESDPTRTLFYCACYQERDILSLHFDITLFRKDAAGTKSWIREFYSVTGPLFKPMVESMGLRSWYYVLNGNSDFVEKQLLGKTSVVRDRIFTKNFAPDSRIVTSSYGWD